MTVAVAQNEHCKDCCCARSWAALGVSEYTGFSIPEHIDALRAENEMNVAQLRRAYKDNERLLILVKRFEELLDGTGDTIGVMSTTDGYYEWSRYEPYIELRAQARAALEQKP